MVTIRLKDRRTNEWSTYPVGYLDWDVYDSLYNPPIDYTPQSGNLHVDGAYVTRIISPDEYAQLSDLEKGAFTIGSPSVGNADQFLDQVLRPDGTKYFLDGHKTEETYTKLYLPEPDEMYTLWFDPLLDDFPATYDGPNTNKNTYGQYWESISAPGWTIDGYHVPQKMSYNAGVIEEGTEYFFSNEASRLFESDTGITFGTNIGVVRNNLLQKYIRATVGSKQIDASVPNTIQASTNFDWLYRNGNDHSTLTTTSGSPQLAPVIDVGPVDEVFGRICPTSRVTTQMLITKRSGVTFVGCAVISWTENNLGDMIPSGCSCTFVPAWLLGGLKGEYDPYEPPVKEDVDIVPPSWTNGTWSIKSQPAGQATVPFGSPLTNIGVGDAGIHVYVVDAFAISKIIDQAWDDMDSAESQSFQSGLISCGFLPQQFIKRALLVPEPTEELYIGNAKVDGLQETTPSTVNHAWLINKSIWVSLQVATFDLTTRTYGDYFDYEPYTSVMISVPFCGDMAIPASCCIGGTVEVVMNCNLTNGDVVASVITTPNPTIFHGVDVQGTKQKTFYMRGNCMCKFPLTGSSTGESQFFESGVRMVGGITQIGAGIATGNIPSIASGATSLISAAYDHRDTNYQPVFGGGPVGGISMIDNKKVVLTITRPSPSESTAMYAHNPYYAHCVGTLDAIKTTNHDEEGNILTDWNLATVKNIFFDEVGMTTAEQQRIISLLNGGVLV